jgi:hypothetical protein
MPDAPHAHPPELVERLRQRIETTSDSYREVAAAFGLPLSTVGRLAQRHGWRRPEGAAPMGEALLRRRTERMRAQTAALLMESLHRQAEALEGAAAPSPAQVRALQQFSQSLHRLDPPAPRRPPPPPPESAPAADEEDDEPPPRSLAELRLALAEHLQRSLAQRRAEGELIGEPDDPVAGLPDRLVLVDGAGI